LNLLAIKRRQRVLDHQGHWNGADRHTAFFVDKILKGANPADLPNERASKFQFVVNLKTAQALGLDPDSAALVLTQPRQLRKAPLSIASLPPLKNRRLI
jgi:hypothetical protein